MSFCYVSYVLERPWLDHTHSCINVSFFSQLVEAELESPDEVWDKAVEGCTLCAHVASPFPIVSPKNEDELIVPVC